MKKLALLLALIPVTAIADKNYNGGKGAVWDCAKDPIVKINHGRGKYTFKGACETIYLNGGQSKLTIESVGTLHVNAAQNTISIGTVDSINLTGAQNKITYKKAKGDSVNVSDNGVGNSVAQTK